MRKFRSLCADESGAITVDWIALTASVLLLGMMVILAIFNGGVSSLVSNLNAGMDRAYADADPGEVPDINRASGGGRGDLNVFGSGNARD